MPSTPSSIALNIYRDVIPFGRQQRTARRATRATTTELSCSSNPTRVVSHLPVATLVASDGRRARRPEPLQPVDAVVSALLRNEKSTHLPHNDYSRPFFRWRAANCCQLPAAIISRCTDTSSSSSRTHTGQLFADDHILSRRRLRIDTTTYRCWHDITWQDDVILSEVDRTSRTDEFCGLVCIGGNCRTYHIRSVHIGEIVDNILLFTAGYHLL